MAENKQAAFHPKGDFFDLKGQNTNVRTEVMAGVTTFFTSSIHLLPRARKRGLGI